MTTQLLYTSIPIVTQTTDVSIHGGDNAFELDTSEDHTTSYAVATGNIIAGFENGGIKIIDIRKIEK
jgi:hypothetical protein